MTDWNFWQKSLDTGITRASYIEQIETLLSTGQIVGIVGSRRCGKSTLLLQFAKHLIQNKNVDSKDILIVNFEDYRFTELSLETLSKIYETYLEKVKQNPKTKPYIFWMKSTESVNGKDS